MFRNSNNSIYFAIFVLMASATMLVACNEGTMNPLGFESESLRTIDTNSDSLDDFIDIDDDGTGDLPLARGCTDPFVDGNSDGIPDFLDLDCNNINDLQLGVEGCIPVPIDLDSDSNPDVIDLDCDGIGDIYYAGPSCLPLVLDSDGDSTFDGIDLDCDLSLDFFVAALPCKDLIDQDSDNVPDGVDLSCDEMIDIPMVNDGCESEIIDEDDDGTPEGIDLDCDGIIDLPVGETGGDELEITACLDSGYQRRSRLSDWVIDTHSHGRHGHGRRDRDRDGHGCGRRDRDRRDHCHRAVAHHVNDGGMCGDDGFYSIRGTGSITMLVTVQDEGPYDMSFVYRVGTDGQDDENLRIIVNREQRYDFEDDDLINSDHWELSSPVQIILKTGINRITFKSTGCDSVHLEQVKITQL